MTAKEVGQRLGRPCGAGGVLLGDCFYDFVLYPDHHVAVTYRVSSGSLRGNSDGIIPDGAIVDRIEVCRPPQTRYRVAALVDW
jgi:hypothetical protein